MKQRSDCYVNNMTSIVLKELKTAVASTIRQPMKLRVKNFYVHTRD